MPASRIYSGVSDTQAPEFSGLASGPRRPFGGATAAPLKIFSSRGIERHQVVLVDQHQFILLIDYFRWSPDSTIVYKASKSALELSRYGVAMRYDCILYYLRGLGGQYT